MARPGQTEPGGHEYNPTGGIKDQKKEGGESAHQPEHSIQPSARAVHRQAVIASRSTGEMGTNIEQAGSSGINKNHQVLVAQIRREHGVSPRSVPHAPPSIHYIQVGILQ